jgi:hypothetical protein
MVERIGRNGTGCKPRGWREGPHLASGLDAEPFEIGVEFI